MEICYKTYNRFKILTDRFAA